MFQADLLLIITRYSMYIQQLVCIMRLCQLAASRILLAASQHKQRIIVKCLLVLITLIIQDAPFTKH